jgi:hypothetical protein
MIFSFRRLDGLFRLLLSLLDYLSKARALLPIPDISRAQVAFVSFVF